MSVIKRGTRAGVAAVALGLSLAGPQAAGIAGAEPADGDASSVSAPRPDQPNRARSGRSAATAGSNDTARRGRLSPGIPDAADTTGVVPIPAGATGSTPAVRVPGRRPAAVRDDTPAQPAGQSLTATPDISPANEVGDSSNTDSGAVTSPTPQPAAAGQPVPAPTAVAVGNPMPPAFQLPPIFTPAPGALAAPIATIGSAVNVLFDSASNWLSGLPASPITKFLEGALLLVRRTLVTMFPALAPGQTTGQSDATDAGAYMTDAELNAYLLELAQQQYGGLFGQTVPVY